MYKKILITMLLSILLISSCATPEITHTPPPIAEDWSVRMIQSGGIAGINRAVEVLSDGSYTVYPQAGADGIIGQLSESDLAKLSSLIQNLQISNVRPSACADCFEYKIEIQGSGKKLVFELDDISLPDSGAGELVMFLQNLFN